MCEEEQNHLLTGAEKCPSGVNSQAAARPRIVVSQRFRLLQVPGIRLQRGMPDMISEHRF